ncbi:PHP domain-containing protein [Papillibacter cinnamivorans]|uniref:PHP domain-containing protein n=1 Tax=Papillibacter cinnamivorans DSM 12816 TaxID=1122930 RepID=A0A1W2AAB6_9FIRM|nr:PHP domain-containing protein [Papillibacter cinnamivorans]SMC57606.1 PHP domain-containing protein [Papillibacter cinnamivorans DSM 12816]
MTDKRTELHLHTRYSRGDGISSPQELLDRALADGQKAMAITDWHTTKAFQEAAAYAADRPIRLIYGLEFRIRRSGGRYHCIALAKNQEGVHILEEIARNRGAAAEELERSRDKLILGSACDQGELYQAVLAGAFMDKLTEIARFYDYLEIQPPDNYLFLQKDFPWITTKRLEENVRTLLEIGKAAERPVIAAGDACYARREQGEERLAYLAKEGFPDLYGPAPLFLRHTGEMLEEFSFLDPAAARRIVVDEPDRIAELCGEIIF